MGYTRKEFLDLIPRALSGYTFKVQGDEISVTLEAGSVQIQVGADKERRFTAHVVIPLLPVKICFTETEPSVQAHFLKQFDRAYMKGLG